jgi:superfamily II DNA/RNA helicase
MFGMPAEIKFSLGTKDWDEAVLRCQEENLRLEREWRGNLVGTLPTELTHLQITALAGEFYKEIYINGEWKSVEREQIKKAVKERTIRLIVATDAACEGLNLQTLGTLINVDLPWNPSRLEQRIGRIKRFGQRRDRVDMLNLLYHGAAQPTVDEKVYEKLSSRMKDRFDIFGTLPDVIDDDWIDDEERLEEELKNYTTRRCREVSGPAARSTGN